MINEIDHVCKRRRHPVKSNATLAILKEQSRCDVMKDALAMRLFNEEEFAISLTVLEEEHGFDLVQIPFKMLG